MGGRAATRGSRRQNVSPAGQALAQRAGAPAIWRYRSGGPLVPARLALAFTLALVVGAAAARVSLGKTLRLGED